MKIGWRRFMKKEEYKFWRFCFKKVSTLKTWLFGFFNYIKCQTNDFKRKTSH